MRDSDFEIDIKAVFLFAAFMVLTTCGERDLIDATVSLVDRIKVEACEVER